MKYEGILHESVKQSPVKKWAAEKIIVDIETGEILKERTKEYYKVTCEIKTIIEYHIINNTFVKYGIRRIEEHVRRTNQGKLEL